jgi:hypothetical protein
MARAFDLVINRESTLLEAEWACFDTLTKHTMRIEFQITSSATINSFLIDFP